MVTTKQTRHLLDGRVVRTVAQDRLMRRMEEGNYCIDYIVKM